MNVFHNKQPAQVEIENTHLDSLGFLNLRFPCFGWKGQNVILSPINWFVHRFVICACLY